MSHRRATALVLVAAAVAAACAVRFVPYSEPLFFYMVAAKQFLASGRITEYHSPGYSLLLAAAFGAGGRTGIYLLHGVLLVAAAATAVHLLRRAGLSPRVCLAGGLTVALNPILVTNVTKIGDTGLVVLLLLSLVTVLVHVREHGISVATTGALMFLVAAILLVRPNMALLFPVVLLAGVRRSPSASHALVRWTAATAGAVVLAVSVTAWTTGQWRLTHPYYSAQAFFNGTNPRAEEFILRDTVGESTYQALVDAGVDFTRVTFDELPPIYWRLSVEFIREHPAIYARLLAVKFMNFFRPYFRAGRAGPAAVLIDIVQALLALPVVIWAILRWQNRGRWRWDSGLFAIVLLPLYALPFIVINSEPRYRWPMDVVLILESVMIAARAWLIVPSCDGVGPHRNGQRAPMYCGDR